MLVLGQTGTVMEVFLLGSILGNFRLFRVLMHNYISIINLHIKTDFIFSSILAVYCQNAHINHYNFNFK